MLDYEEKRIIDNIIDWSKQANKDARELYFDLTPDQEPDLEPKEPDYRSAYTLLECVKRSMGDAENIARILREIEEYLGKRVKDIRIQRRTVSATGNYNFTIEKDPKKEGAGIGLIESIVLIFEPDPVEN